MTPRDAAIKAELEALIDYFGKRTMALAGDAAEIKAALVRAQERIADLEGRTDTPSL